MDGRDQGVEVKAVGGTRGPTARARHGTSFGLACATGGPLAAAVRALQMWVEARVTTIEVEAGGRRFTVTGATAREVLPEVVAAVRALEELDPPAAGGTDPAGPDTGTLPPGAGGAAGAAARSAAAEAADGQA